MRLGEFARHVGEVGGSFDEIDLGDDCVEVCNSRAELPARQSAHPPRFRKCRSRLGIEQPTLTTSVASFHTRLQNSVPVS